MSDISLIGAFLGGLLSFLSPCVLPIVPGYLSYLSGVGASQKETKGFNFPVFLSALLFVMGFSIAFTLMGAGATLLGQSFRDYQDLVVKVGGGVVVFFGLHFAGVFLRKNFLMELLGVAALFLSLYFLKVISQETLFTLLGIVGVVFFLYSFSLHEVLYRQMRVEVKGSTSFVGAFLMGLLFAFGWSPCIGPVLGTILLYASQQETALKGASLLFFYSLGLGIPFVVGGAFLSIFLEFIKKFSRFFHAVEVIGGLLLVLLGYLLASGKLAEISTLLGA